MTWIMVPPRGRRKHDISAIPGSSEPHFAGFSARLLASRVTDRVDSTRSAARVKASIPAITQRRPKVFLSGAARGILGARENVAARHFPHAIETVLLQEFATHDTATHGEVL
jgi:hypothetical protein